MPKLFTNVFGYTSTLSAWIRPNGKGETTPAVLNVMRTIKDVEADATRRYVHVCVCVYVYVLVYVCVYRCIFTKILIYYNWLLH